MIIFQIKYKHEDNSSKIKTCRDLNPNYTLIEEEEIYYTLPDDLKSIYDSSSFNVKLDILKFHYLYENGGFFVDNKLKCVESFNDLLDFDFIVLHNKDNNEYVSNLLGVKEKNNIIIKNILEEIKNDKHNYSFDAIIKDSEESNLKILNYSKDLPPPKGPWIHAIRHYDVSGNIIRSYKPKKLIKRDEIEFNVNEEFTIVDNCFVTINPEPFKNDKIVHGVIYSDIKVYGGGYLKRIIDYVDKIFYINLEYRKDRKEHVEKELRKIDPFFEKVERFDAIKDNKNGHVGCYKSHLKVLDMCIEQNLENVLVVEDDFIFRDNYKEKLLKLINHDPDFDILLLGANNLQAKKQKNNIYKVRYSTSTTGFIYNRNIFKKLKDVWEQGLIKLSNGGNRDLYCCDRSWNKLFKNNKVYTNKIGIATQLENYSDIEKRVMKYNTN